MNGLGFNRFVAGYLAGVKTDGSGTLPSITTPWVLNKFAADWFNLTQRAPGVVYPFIGGTAIAHSKDLFLRRDLTWFGTVTHNASGMQGNGTDGLGLLGASRDLFPDINKYTMGIYVNTNVTNGNMYDIGNVGLGQICLNSRASTVAAYAIGKQSVAINVAVGSSLGLFWLRRDSAGASYSFLNATNNGSQTVASDGTVPANTYVGSIGTSTYFTTRRYGFAFITQSILQTPDPYPLIQALQTHCGRAV
jgi:hypothetical protein